LKNAAKIADSETPVILKFAVIKKAVPPHSLRLSLSPTKCEENIELRIEDFRLKVSITRRRLALVMSLNSMYCFGQKGDRMSQINYPWRRKLRTG
jgi:hypothetical protein